MKPSALLYFLWDKNLSVLDSFLSRSNRVVVTSRSFCTPALMSVVDRHGSTLVQMEDLLTAEDHGRLANEFEQRYHRCHESLRLASVPASLEDFPVKEKVLETLQEQLPAALQWIQALDRVYSRYSIELLAVNEDYMLFARTAVAWARAHEIPSLHLIHGLALSTPYTVHRHADADITAVFGERGMEPYLDMGIPEERLRVTGNPAWDGYPRLIAQREAVRAESLSSAGLSPDRSVVVFATTWTADLTVIHDTKLPTELMRQVFRAVKTLRDEGGVALHLVVKDRPGADYVQVGREQALAIARDEGLEAGDFAYLTTDTEKWVVSADVLIACDSNISVEAMMAGVPAVNLLNLNGLRLGPSFDADSGVLEVEPPRLADALRFLLTDAAFRQRQLQQAHARAGYYNLGFDGSAAHRVASLMLEMAGSAKPDESLPAISGQRYVWQSLDDSSSAVGDAAAEYHHHVRHELIALFQRPPKQVLDVGCAAGVTGEAIKHQYPGVSVLGIEINKATLGLARQRLDRVIEGSIEELDLLNYGIALGSIDTVILADVLEHMYNPWGVLERLRPYLTADAQVIASIPNSRHLSLLADLAHGHWTYREEGLLDVTHIRFFTLAEIHKLFEETGYTVEQVDATRTGDFPPVQPGGSLTLGKLVLKDLSEQDIFELQAFQILVRARPITALARQAGAPATRLPAFEPTTLVQPPTAPVDLYALYRQRRDAAILPVNGASKDSPVIGFIVPCRANEQAGLADTLDSLATQSVGNWRLTVLADFPAPDSLFDEVEALRWVDSREQGLFEGIVQYVASSDSSWICVTEPGVRLLPRAVESIAHHAHRSRDWRLLYADSDHVVSADGAVGDPRLRPDFNLDLLRSSAYMGECLFVEREAFIAAGGWGTIVGAERYDLTLRLLDFYGEGAVGHIDDILYHVPVGRSPLDEQAHRQALLKHLERHQIKGFISEGYQPGTWRVTYLHSQNPKVSILIPSKDQVELLRTCVESILDKTQYKDYEIIVVDNNSSQPEALRYLDSLAVHGDKIRVLTYPKPFNYSAICNLAAREARGEYLLLLNNDTQVLQETWLDLLMYHGQRPEVGVVGPKLLFPGTSQVQHAGVVLGLGGIAEHPYLGLLGPGDPGYMNRALVDQDLSAVTGACLLIRRSLYEQTGGLDEARFKVSYNDIDLCLKVGQLGYKVLWTPYVMLLHHGSASQQAEAQAPHKVIKAQERFEGERAAMLDKWLPQIARDPAYNRHLSLIHRDYRVESDFVVNWDPRLPPEHTRVLAWMLDGAPTEYRIRCPLEALGHAGATEVSYVYPPGRGLIRSLLLAEIVRANPQIFTTSVFQGLQDHLDTLKQIRRYTEIPIILQLDDFVAAIPKGSHAYAQRHTPGELKKILAQAHRVVASTQPIFESTKGLCADVQLVPNYLPGYIWDGLTSARRQGVKPRVGWAGAMQHGGDLALIAEVVKATAGEVEWVFFGMLPDDLAPFVREFHPFGPFEDYPAKLASLNLDLAIAPLEANKFNEGKSNLRLLEYGYMGWPVVCSDVLPYRNAPVTRVKNDPQAWIAAIRERVHDLDAAEREGDALRQWVVENWMLEDHLEEWARAYSFGG